LIAPLAAHLSTTNLVAWNVLGTALAMSFVLALVGKHVAAMHRRNLVEWTTNLRHLDSAEFEYLVGEVFRREGWDVRETGRQYGPDGNIDLQLARAGQRNIVQCKCWERKAVGVDEIRKFAGTLLREDLRGESGIFVTLSDFTPQARVEATQHGIVLVDGVDLFARVEKARRDEPCPDCGMPMRLGRSQMGWWFRCVADGCHGKRDLGNQPAQAVELLTQSA
jgi:hypothetical protein